jgi:phage gp29-like protein
MRAALRSHIWGIFDAPAQLCESILGDDRVQATLGSRITGLFGCEPILEPADDSRAAKECLDAWVKCWPNLASPAVMSEMQAYALIMGFEHAQLCFEMDVPGVDYAPLLMPWNARWTYYHWQLRRHIAISQDGPVVIDPGGGKWVTHAPYGEYRGWIRGGLRAIAEPWLMRHWGFRDWARYSEVHGIPIRKAIVPAASNEEQRDRFVQQVANVGNETTVMLAKGVDGENSYDLEYAEPQDDSWQSFPGLIDRCDMSIVLALIFQNLTTEVKGGAFAATESHMDIREGALVFDDSSWQHTMRQVARPFAALNFGDPYLAPKSRWNVPRLSERAASVAAFAQFGNALEVLARGGVQFKSERAVRSFASKRFGLKGLPAFTISPPPAASSGSGGGSGGATGTGGSPAPSAKPKMPKMPKPGKDGAK